MLIIRIYFSFHLKDIENAVSKVNLDLLNISDVSRAHKLVLNESKTELLVFGTHKENVASNPDFNIIVNEVPLVPSNSCKNLGLYLDVDLRFTTHVNCLLQKSYCKLKTLYIHKDFLSPDIKLRLCDALILSNLAYCDIVFWPALLSKDKNSLQKIQNSCLRFIYNLRKFDHISDKFRESHWLNLDERFQLHMACLIYKINNLKLPEYLFLKLIKGSLTHDCPTRSRDLYTVPRHNSAQFERSFVYNATKIYNSLPPNIKSASSLPKFRDHIKNLLFNNRNN